MTTLAERIEALLSQLILPINDQPHWNAILVEARELESAAKFASDELTFAMHDVRDGNNGCRLCEAQGKLSDALTKTRIER